MVPIDPNTKKLEMTSEQIGNVIQVPIVMNNEVYLVQQRDTRKIIDTRYISVQRVLNNGEMESSAVPDTIFEILNLSQAMQKNIDLQNCEQFKQQLCQLCDHDQHLKQPFQTQQLQQSEGVCDKVRFLLNLDNSTKGSPVSQFHNCMCTSTTELENTRKKFKFNSRHDRECCCCCNCSSACRCQSSMKCKGVNTEMCDENENDEQEQNALEKLKERKIYDDNNFW